MKRFRDRGVLIGLSAHDPTLIEEAEHRGWDVGVLLAKTVGESCGLDNYSAVGMARESSDPFPRLDRPLASN